MQDFSGFSRILEPIFKSDRTKTRQLSFGFPYRYFSCEILTGTLLQMNGAFGTSGSITHFNKFLVAEVCEHSREHSQLFRSVKDLARKYLSG